MDSFVGVLGQIVVAIPLIAVYVVGLIIAIARWRQHPRVSQLATVALVMLLVERLIGVLMTTMLPLLISRNGMSISDVTGLYAVYGVLSALFTAVAFGILLWALFGWRRQGTPV